MKFNFLFGQTQLGKASIFPQRSWHSVFTHHRLWLGGMAVPKLCVVSAEWGWDLARGKEWNWSYSRNTGLCLSVRGEWLLVSKQQMSSTMALCDFLKSFYGNCLIWFYNSMGICLSAVVISIFRWGHKAWNIWLIQIHSWTVEIVWTLFSEWCWHLTTIQKDYYFYPGLDLYQYHLKLIGCVDWSYHTGLYWFYSKLRPFWFFMTSNKM